MIEEKIDWIKTIIYAIPFLFSVLIPLSFIYYASKALSLFTTEPLQFLYICVFCLMSVQVLRMAPTMFGTEFKIHYKPTPEYKFIEKL